MSEIHFLYLKLDLLGSTFPTEQSVLLKVNEKSNVVI